jgi:hypothetical protein
VSPSKSISVAVAMRNCIAPSLCSFLLVIEFILFSHVSCDVHVNAEIILSLS